MAVDEQRAFPSATAEPAAAIAVDRHRLTADAILRPPWDARNRPSALRTPARGWPELTHLASRGAAFRVVCCSTLRRATSLSRNAREVRRKSQRVVCKMTCELHAAGNISRPPPSNRQLRIETIALNDLVTGRIQIVLISGTLAPHVREGRIRGLAALGNQRSKMLPELPTMAERGSRLPRRCRGWVSSARRSCPLRSWSAFRASATARFIHGKLVVRDGRLLTADESAIMRTAEVAARKIWSIAEARRILPPRA